MGVLNVQGGSNGLPIPSEALMAQLVNMKKVGGMLESERQAVIDLVVFIYGTEVAPDYYYPMVEGFLGHQIIHRSIVECGAHKIEQLPALIESRMGRTKIGRKKGISIVSEFRRTVTTQPIPTGFDIIDTPMMGGLPRGEYGILCAYTGLGKTTAALNFAAGAARMGFKTCFFTLELTEEKIRERLYSLIGRYNYDRIRYGDPQRIKTKDEIWAEVEEAVRLNGTHPNGQVWADNIRIFDFSRDTCSISHIEDCIKEEQDDDPENPPAQAMIDWLLCLDESPGYDPRKMGPGEVRHKLQRYSDDISKKICRGQSVSCWATHQADAKAEEEDKITMAHAAEGKSVGWKCSAYVGIGASSKNRQDNIFTVNASKMRDGRLFTGRLKGHLHEQRFEDMTEADQQVIQQTSSITEDLILSRQMAQRRLQENQKQEGVILPK